MLDDPHSSGSLADAQRQVYCTAGSACSCPATSPKAGFTFVPMTAGVQYIGVTGGLNEATETLTGMSLEDFCGLPCPFGDWISTNVVTNLFNGHGAAGWRLTFIGDRLTIDYNGGAPMIYTLPTDPVTYEYWLFSGGDVDDVTFNAGAAGAIIAKPLENDASVRICVETNPCTAPNPTKYGALADVQAWACSDSKHMTLRGAGPIGDYSVDLVRVPTSSTTP
jgi:hypothetical protein